MQEYKISNFEKLYPRAAFPLHESLPQQECKRLREKIGDSLGLKGGSLPLDIIRRLHSEDGEDMGSVPDDEALNLRTLLKGVEIGRPCDVLVNWYRFDDIDRFDLDVLAAHFGDVWYPGVDDIEIFDESCLWFLSVSHDGRVEFIRPRNSA